MQRFPRILLFLILAVFLVAGSARDNYALCIADTYYGANDHGWEDVIGAQWRFDIESMSISITGLIMHVDIRTAFDQKQNYPLGDPVLFGDFFISTNGWSPAGTAPYLSDNMSNGEDWEYAYHLSGNPGIAYDKGTSYIGQLYQIGSSSIIESSAPSGWIYRNGQEVLIDPSGTAFSSGSWYYADEESGSYGHLVMEFEIPALWDPFCLGYHWAMTCGNDVIEAGGAPVPEPATMLLLGVGLIGLAGVGRKRFLKKP